MKDALFLHLNLPTVLSIGEVGDAASLNENLLTIARLHLVWLSLSVLVLPTVPKES